MTTSSRTRTGAVCLLLVAGSLAIWGLGYRVYFHELGTKDAVDYAQLSRQFATDSRITSLQTFPFVLGWLRAHEQPTDPPWPNLNRFPLPILTGAAAMAAFGASDTAAVLPGAVFLAATAVALYLLGRRLYGESPALIAAALYAASPATLVSSLNGLTEIGAGFFVVAAALALSRTSEPGRSATANGLVLGVVIGLGILQRSNLALLAPIGVGLLMLGPERRGSRAVVALCAGALLPLSPLIAQRLADPGTVVAQLTLDRGLLQAVLGSDPFHAFAQYDTWAVALANPGAFGGVLHPTWWAEHWTTLFGKGLFWVGPLVLLAWLGRPAARVRTIWLFAVGALLATWLLLGWMDPRIVRYYLPFAPICLLLAVGSGVGLLQRLPGLRRRAPALLGAAAVVASAAAFVIWASGVPRALPAAQDPLLRAVRDTVASDAVVASNESQRIAWYARRPSVRYLGDPEQLVAMATYTTIAAVALRGESATRFREALPASSVADTYREVPLPGDAGLWLRTPGRSDLARPALR